jgi:hypothetical protein
MQVETYEQQELSSDLETEDLSSPEALALIEELGLTGQDNLLNRRSASEGDEVVTRNPYRLMTMEEQRVLTACFPQATPIEDFDFCPIPLRVLQVAAHARSCIENIELVVWHPRDSTDHDPVLVGKFVQGYTTKFYILARWGEALESIEKLKGKARLKIIAKAQSNIKRIEHELAGVKSGLSEKVDVYLDGENPNLPYIGSVAFGD